MLEKIKLSAEGPDISPIVAGAMRLGKWGAQLNQSHYQAFIEGCLGGGVTTFDHADIYGGHTTEREFGAVLKAQPHLRDQMQIITKCGIVYPSDQKPANTLKHYNSSQAYVMECVEQSLRSLKTEVIDILLIHRPDYLMNPEALAETFMLLKKSGKVLHFGVSNFKPSQWYILNEYFPLVTNQIEVSITHLEPFEDGSIDHALLENYRPMAWSPLGGGSLFATKKSDRATRILHAAAPLMEKYGYSLDVLLIAWLLKHPVGIIPVIGSSKVLRVINSAEALDLNFTHEEWYSLWVASTGEEVA